MTDHNNNYGFLIHLIVAAVLTLLPAVAISHTGIATTVPDHDAILERAPTLLRFQFPGDVTITNARILSVNDKLMQTGETITLRLPRNRLGQSTAFGQEIELEIPPLDTGMYQVVFQAVTIDGHALADDFTFKILGDYQLSAE